MNTTCRASRLDAALSTAACLFTMPALAQDCPERVGRSPYGTTYALAWSESYVYFGSGAVLGVADYSDPFSPRVVGEVVLPDTVHDVAVFGRYGCVADDGSGLRVIDVSDPGNPFELGFFDTPGQANRVAVSGGYAYLTDAGPGGLQVIKVSDPTRPREVGFHETPEEAVGVAISGGYVHVAAGDAGLEIFDASDCSRAPEWETNYPGPPASSKITTVDGSRRGRLYGEDDPEHGVATGTAAASDIDTPLETTFPGSASSGQGQQSAVNTNATAQAPMLPTATLAFPLVADSVPTGESLPCGPEGRTPDGGSEGHEAWWVSPPGALP